MYSPRKGNPGASGVLTPHEFAEEHGDILAQFNGGLDRENIGAGEIRPENCDAAQFNLYFTAEATVIGAARESSVTAAHIPGSLRPIPNNVGNALEHTVDVPGDGDLHITLGGSAEMNTAGVVAFVSVAIMVDGVLIARADDNSRLTGNAFEVDARVPVTAGSHRISYMWTFTDKITTLGAVRQINWQECSAFVRWVGV